MKKPESNPVGLSTTFDVFLTNEDSINFRLEFILSGSEYPIGP